MNEFFVTPQGDFQRFLDGFLSCERGAESALRETLDLDGENERDAIVMAICKVMEQKV